MLFACVPGNPQHFCNVCLTISTEYMQQLNFLGFLVGNRRSYSNFHKYKWNLMWNLLGK